MSIILVGPSILKQWQHVLSHFNLRVHLVLNMKSVQLVKENIYKDPCDFDVLLVTWSMFNFLMKATPGVMWHRLMWDEPAHSRIPKMSMIFALFTWLISGTMEQLVRRENSLRFSPFLTQVCPHRYTASAFLNKFKAFSVSMPKEFVESSFSNLTLPRTTKYVCVDRLSSAMGGLVSDNVINLFRSGDIASALRALNARSVDNLFAKLIADKVRLVAQNNATLAHVRAISLEEDEIAFAQRNVALAEKALQDVQQRVSQISDMDCPICHEKVENGVLEVKCQNVFCAGCIFSWIGRKLSCPMCRARIVIREHLVSLTSAVHQGAGRRGIGPVAEEEARENERVRLQEATRVQRARTALVQSGKASRIVVLQEIIDSTVRRAGEEVGFASSSPFIVVFSRLESGCNTVIRDALSEINVVCKQLKGTCKTRAATLGAFRRGEIPVLLLDSSVDCAGVNLECAKHLVFFHAHLSDREQLVGRAMRLDRTDEAPVIHEIEEPVL
jgi:hypothetical protein